MKIDNCYALAIHPEKHANDLHAQINAQSSKQSHAYPISGYSVSFADSLVQLRRFTKRRIMAHLRS